MTKATKPDYLKTTRYGVNPMIPHKDARPRCGVSGCNRPRAIQQTCVDGRPRYRHVCDAHHSQRTASKYGYERIAQITASRLGISETQYRNRSHPSRKYRKPYCENVDGRLGFVCTTTIPKTLPNGKVFDGWLDVDHIDGNPNNNNVENFQTLCSCCHAYKTLVNGDSKTPGRKFYRITR
jgi:hypothetical protein